MNAIQQISLKIKMGIDPHREIEPEKLRSMWQTTVSSRFSARQSGPQARASKPNLSGRAAR